MSASGIYLNITGYKPKTITCGPPFNGVEKNKSSWLSTQTQTEKQNALCRS